jgi:lipopolysaccharide export LptBFGC system permease protein LptF
MSEDKEKTIHVKVDSSQITEMAQELAKEKLKNEKLAKQLDKEIESQVDKEFSSDDLKEKDTEIAKALLEDMKERMSLAYEKEGIPFDSTQIRSMQDIDTHAKILSTLQKREFKTNTPSGHDLVSQQLGEKQKNGSYPSVEAMIDDLHDRAEVFRGTKEGNEAEKILNELFKKGIQGQKENQQLFKQYQRPLPELVSKDGLLVPSDKNEGDLAQWTKTFRRRKKIERDEKGVVAQ